MRRLFRRREHPLGDGVWRRAHDRFGRAVERVVGAVDAVPAGPVREALAVEVDRLIPLQARVFAVCAAGQQAAPSATQQVPGGDRGRYLDAHRALSRAAGLVAQAAEAVTLARVADAGQLAGPNAVRQFAGPARRAVDQVAAQVGRAADLVPPA